MSDSLLIVFTVLILGSAVVSDNRLQAAGGEKVGFRGFK